MSVRVRGAAAVAALAVLLPAGLAPATNGAKSGGTIRILASGDPTLGAMLDPQRTLGNSYAEQILFASCALLVMHPDDGRATVVPEGAVALPETSRDRRTYTFTVRSGWRFSDGRPLTAANYKAALERVRDPALEGPRFLFVNIESIAARGRKLTIRLSQPDGGFLSKLALPPACPIPVGLPRDPAGVPFVPASGPYMVASADFNREIVLAHNPRYRGTRDRVPNRIVVSIGGSPDVNTERIERGEADILWEDIQGDVVRRLFTRYGVNRSLLRVSSGLLTHRLIFNPKSPIFGPRTKLRQAVNFALDRPELERRALDGNSSLLLTPTDQMVPIGYPGWQDYKIYPLKGPNLVEARRLAGRDLGDGKVAFYTRTAPRHRRLAEAVAFQLSKIGLQVEVRTFATDVLLEKIETPGEPWDITAFGWGADVVDPANYVIPLYEGQVNQTVDRKIREADLLSGTERWRAFVALEAEIHRRWAPDAPYASTQLVFLVGPRLGCIQTHPRVELVLNKACLKE